MSVVQTRRPRGRTNTPFFGRTLHPRAASLGSRIVASDVLTLPAIHKRVPAACKYFDSGLNLIPEALAEMDILRPEHWSGSPVESALKALSQLDSFTHIDLGIQICNDVQESKNDGFYFMKSETQTLTEALGLPDETKLGFFALTSNDSKWFTMKKRVTEIENQFPGVGKMIYDTMIKAFAATVDCLSPQGLLDCASRLHWQGENDEATAIEEFLNSEQVENPPGSGKYRDLTDAEISAQARKVDWYRRSDFEKTFPSWTFKEEERVGLPLVSVFSVGDAPPPIRTLIDLAEDIKRSLEKRSNFGNLMYKLDANFSQLSAPAIVHWSEKDDTVRLTDDTYNQECSGGDVIMDIIYLTAFNANSKESIKDAFRPLVPMLELASKAEKLLIGISDLEDRTR